MFLAPWLALMRARLRSRGVLANDQVFGLAATGRLDSQQMIDFLRRLPPGITEIYLHPTATNNELAALLNPNVRAAVDASLAVCGGYRDVQREQQNSPH